jgi:recombination endonuclease VII
MASTEVFKRCTRCETKKSINDFSSDKRTKSGKKTWCKACMNAYTRRYVKENPLTEEQKRQRRDWYLQRTYGVSVDWVDSQVCNICGSSGSGSRSLHVDHDHSCCPGVKSCGKCIRGVLCYTCNAAIGYFYDNPAILQKAIDYLGGRHVLAEGPP